MAGVVKHTYCKRALLGVFGGFIVLFHQLMRALCQHWEPKYFYNIGKLPL